MKKTTKKLLTFALSTLFVGAGLGGSIAAYNAINTNVALAEEAAEKTAVDISGITPVGKWGKGDYPDNMAHIRLNVQGCVGEWTGATNNAHLPATVLNNVWVNGKSISQHNAEYKALIDSGAASPITWDTSKAFSAEIADDVNNNRAVYAPIFIKLVNHGAGLAGNTIDIYIPNSYLSAADIQELRITKDFLYEQGDYKFCVSDDVIFKSNSLCVPDKYIGEASIPVLNLNVKETEIQKLDGRNGAFTGVDGDTMFSFYISENDYPTNGDVSWSGSNDFLKQINFYDYILIDGVKMGKLWNYAAPGEKFTCVWGRMGAFTIRWPNNINNEAAKKATQKIEILAGCQFPSATDPEGTVYEVKEDTTLVKLSDGLFISEDYVITDEKLTISEATVAGEAGELLAFDVTFDAWNSTCNKEDYNYFGGHYVAMRQNILLNGVSLWDINANTDDSNYVYSTSPWTSPELDPSNAYPYQVHQNPTHITGEGNKLTIYIHKQLVADKGWNKIDVTFAKSFSNHATPAYVVIDPITANVWAKDVTVTLDGAATTYKYGDTVTLTAPAAIEGKTFVKWIDAAGNEVTEFTAENDVTLTSVWENIIYTATVVNGETRTPVQFTVDNRAEKLAEIKAMLPENTEDYTYTWAEALPEELALNNDQVFTVAAEAMFVMVDLAIDQEVEITIPAGKYAKAEVYTMVGGYVVVSYWQDLIITINGEEYVYDPVKLMPARAGTNIITIKSVSGEAVTDTITISSYRQDDYEMNVGANEVYVLDAQAGRNATFTAEVDGEYTFSFAEGEENGAISVITEDEYGMSSEMITMPYTVTLTAGETITFTIGTMNWESDTIEINVEAPYVTSDVWPGEETTISIPEGKYFSTNVYSRVGGKFTVSWSGDVTVEINGEAVENGAVVELITSYEGPNTLVIKAANNAAAEVVLNLANYKEPATPIAVGNVNVTVSVENFYCAGVEVIFTATEAGEYKLSVAEGEENADVTLVEENVTEWIENLPYSFTLEAGESITFIIATTNVMVESDEINLVLEKVEVTPPAGGDDEGEGEGEGTNPPAGDEGENTNPPAGDEGENTNPPATEEEKPGIIDQVKGMIPGCSGVVGGIAGGAAALGLAVVALLKKKEDNE